ncbi:hypothetical protein MMON_50090 [Mycolicibacterium monacense]|uniref:Uncharacterized protein n=1 Tax=Mycolicibacterium monacense TaxID=85693 RepID=A0AAD1J036_MYCMB|nr:hypothetical protein MMON_50090 [Mycolicibacterium monacense]
MRVSASVSVRPAAETRPLCCGSAMGASIPYERGWGVRSAMNIGGVRAVQMGSIAPPGFRMIVNI